MVLSHLPGLGRVSISISQKFHFKNGKIYRFTVKITVNYGQMGIFDDLAIARKKALQTPLFSAMLRETNIPPILKAPRLTLVFERSKIVCDYE